MIGIYTIQMSKIAKMTILLNCMVLSWRVNSEARALDYDGKSTPGLLHSVPLLNNFDYITRTHFWF